MFGLEDLSEEIIDTIVRILDLSDVCNLRLTSATLASKCSQGHFKEYFHVRRLDPTDSRALTSFNAFTDSAFGKLIKTLKICSVATPAWSERTIDACASERTIDACAASITKALGNLTHLDELILEVDEMDEEGVRHKPGMVLHKYDDGWNRVPRSEFIKWRETWLAATFTFRVTMAALRESPIDLGRLDVFSSVDRCSLACDQLSYATKPSTPGCYAQLRSLSLSLSHQLKYAQSGDHVSRSANTQQDVTMIAEGLERLLRSCPLLESLELHWFRLKYSDPATDPFDDGSLLDFFSSAPNLKSLQTCVLRGFRVNSDALVRFLSLAKLQSVTLKDLVLRQGSFRPVFDFFQECPLQELHLDNLVERDRICFRGGGGRPRVGLVGQRGPEWIDRLGTEARKPIRYVVCKQSRMRGSKMVWIAPARACVQYGPPDASAGEMRWMRFV